LLKGLGSLAQNLELVEADLLKKETVIAAIEGASYVIHTASPVPADRNVKEEDLIPPALGGTKAVLEGCEKAGVKRLVVTSSTATCVNYDDPSKYIFDEESWCNVETNPQPYAKAKALAEKAAWDHVKKTGSFELVVILPTMVIGPVVTGEDFASGDMFIKKIILGE
jgi:dihydroflavonol-4-reductase